MEHAYAFLSRNLFVLEFHHDCHKEKHCEHSHYKSHRETSPTPRPSPSVQLSSHLQICQVRCAAEPIRLPVPL